MSAKGGAKELSLSSITNSYKMKSTLRISAEQKSASRDIYSLKFSAKKLDDKDFFGKSDPYLEIARSELGWPMIFRKVIKKFWNFTDFWISIVSGLSV